MEIVEINNQELLSIFHEYSEWLFQQPLDSLPRLDDNESIETIDKKVSDKYRKKVERNPDHVGFPLSCKAVSLNDVGGEGVSKELVKCVEEFKYRIANKLGASNNALHFYYPENGYIGWHTNENAPGSNLILSYSTDGLGWFKYRDPITKEIVTIPDQVGWNAKMGKFGPEEENKVWHCARNFGPRLTISYIVRNRSMWEDLKEELQES